MNIHNKTFFLALFSVTNQLINLRDIYRAPALSSYPLPVSYLADLKGVMVGIIDGGLGRDNVKENISILDGNAETSFLTLPQVLETEISQESGGSVTCLTPPLSWWVRHKTSLFHCLFTKTKLVLFLSFSFSFHLSCPTT